MNQGNVTPPTSRGKGVQASKLSSSLKERLKKCGRYHPGTPVSGGSHSHNSSPLTPRSSNPLTPHSSNPLTPHSSNPLTSHPDTIPSEKNHSGTSQSLTPSSCHSAKSSSHPGTPLSGRKHLDTTDPSTRNNPSTPDTYQSVRFTKKRKLEDRIDSISENNINTESEELSNNHEEIHVDPNHSVIRNRTKKPSDAASTKTSISSSDASVVSRVGDSHIDVSDKALDQLVTMKRDMQHQVQEQEEKLRKLKMVKMYREKNDLRELQRLIDLWRAVTQRGLTNLVTLHPPPRPSMEEFLVQLGVDPGFVGYDQEEDGFV